MYEAIIDLPKCVNHSPMSLCVCPQPGKEFDALLVDVKAPQPTPVFDIFDRDTLDVRMYTVHHLTCTYVTLFTCRFSLSCIAAMSNTCNPLLWS